MIHDEGGADTAAGRPDGIAASVAGPSLLLVELLNAGRFGNPKVQAYPFIAGWLAARRHACAWVCVAPADQQRGADPCERDLEGRAREWLVGEIRARRATHVLLSEAPTRSLREHLAAACPEVAVRFSTGPGDEHLGASGWLLRWLELPQEPEPYLPDLASPDYRSHLLGRTTVTEAPATALLGGPGCLYSASLRHNPHYAGLDLSGAKRGFGCAFCVGPARLSYPYRVPPLELALRQIRAVAATTDTCRSRHAFQLTSAWLFQHLDELLGAVVDAGIPPSSFYCSARGDELIARATHIERALALASAHGHQIHLVSIGTENFSPTENERLNKGLDQARLRQALALLRGWEQQHPAVFHYSVHGGLGFILFTPWTTLADLEQNRRAIQEVCPEHARFALTRRLMLLAGTPIALLAEHDGLTRLETPEQAALFEWVQRHCDPGCRHWVDDQELAWRFRDPLAAATCAISMHLAVGASVPAAAPCLAHLLAAVPEAADGTALLERFALLLDVAAAHEGPATLDALTDAFGARVMARPT